MVVEDGEELLNSLPRVQAQSLALVPVLDDPLPNRVGFVDKPPYQRTLGVDFVFGISIVQNDHEVIK